MGNFSSEGMSQWRKVEILHLPFLLDSLLLMCLTSHLTYTNSGLDKFSRIFESINGKTNAVRILLMYKYKNVMYVVCGGAISVKLLLYKNVSILSSLTVKLLYSSLVTAISSVFFIP